MNEIILTITLLHFLALISPGPDFFLCIKNALISRNLGIMTSIGFGLGILVHLIYCTLGLALIISQSIIAFTILKYIAAAYLVYLGICLLKTRKHSTEHNNNNNNEQERKININLTQTSHQSTPIIEKSNKTSYNSLKAMRDGFLTNALNPKATLFFLSIFTVVITPQTPKLSIIIAGLITIINTVLWFSFISIIFSSKKIKNIYEKIEEKANKILGVLLISLGIKIAFSK
jgi:threonine/homoserine/homoserine lactone efflux protein